VFAERLAGGLATRDQCRRTGSGSALETLRGDALYKYMFILVYFCQATESKFGLVLP